MKTILFHFLHTKLCHKSECLFKLLVFLQMVYFCITNYSETYWLQTTNLFLSHSSTVRKSGVVWMNGVAQSLSRHCSHDVSQGYCHPKAWQLEGLLPGWLTHIAGIRRPVSCLVGISIGLFERLRDMAVGFLHGWRSQRESRKTPQCFFYVVLEATQSVSLHSIHWKWVPKSGPHSRRREIRLHLLKGRVSKNWRIYF